MRHFAKLYTTHCYSYRFDFGWLQEVLVLVYMLITWLGPSLLWFLAALCFLFLHAWGYVSTLSCGPANALLNWVTSFPGRTCLHTAKRQRFFFFKRTFFAEGCPDGARKSGRMRPETGPGPVWTSVKTLCIFCSVVMYTCWPLQLIVKSRQQVV